MVKKIDYFVCVLKFLLLLKKTKLASTLSVAKIRSLINL